MNDIEVRLAPATPPATRLSSSPSPSPASLEEDSEDAIAERIKSEVRRSFASVSTEVDALQIAAPPSAVPKPHRLFAKADSFLKSRFALLITAVVALGAIFPHASNASKELVVAQLPGPGAPWSLDLPTLALYMMMLSASIHCDPKDFLKLAKAPRAFLIALGLYYVVVPLLGAGLATTSRHLVGGAVGVQYAAGILLIVLMPVAMTSNIWVRQARGELPLSVSMTTLTTALSVPVTPIYLAGLLNLSSNDIKFPVDTLARMFVVCIIVPLVMGVTLRVVASRWVRRWHSIFGLGGQFGLLFAVFANIGAAVTQFKAVTLLAVASMIVIVVLLNAINYGMAYFLGQAADLDYAEQAALGFAGGMRSNGTALVVGLKTFPAYPLVTIPAVIYIISQHLFASAFVKLMRKKVPFCDTVLEPKRMLAELRRLNAASRHSRRLTVTFVQIAGVAESAKVASALATSLRGQTNAADLVAVEGSVIAVAFIARHTVAPDLRERLGSIWKGAPLTMRVASASGTLGQSAPDELYARCSAQLARA